MSLMIKSKEKYIRKSNSQKHSRKKSQDSDMLEEMSVPSGVTYTVGCYVPTNNDSLQQGRRPNRSSPIHATNDIEELQPMGEALKAMAEKFPAPTEWSHE